MNDTVQSEQEHGFSIIYHELLTIFSPTIGCHGICTYIALMSFAAFNDPNCYPSIKTIGQRAAISESSVKRALTVLEDVGLLRIKHRKQNNGSPSSNLYTLTNVQAAIVYAKKNNKLKSPPINDISGTETDDIEGKNVGSHRTHPSGHTEPTPAQNGASVQPEPTWVHTEPTPPVTQNPPSVQADLLIITNDQYPSEQEPLEQEPDICAQPENAPKQPEQKEEPSLTNSVRPSLKIDSDDWIVKEYENTEDCEPIVFAPACRACKLLRDAAEAGKPVPTPLPNHNHTVADAPAPEPPQQPKSNQMSQALAVQPVPVKKEPKEPVPFPRPEPPKDDWLKYTIYLMELVDGANVLDSRYGRYGKELTSLKNAGYTQSEIIDAYKYHQSIQTKVVPVAYFFSVADGLMNRARRGEPYMDTTKPKVKYPEHHMSMQELNAQRAAKYKALGIGSEFQKQA